MENIAFRIGNFGRRYCFRGSVAVVGILPVIHFKAAEQDPKQGILVICQLIFMIVVGAIIFLLLLSLFKKAMLRRITGRKAKVKSGFYRIKYTCKKRYMGCYDGDCRRGDWRVKKS